MPYEKIYNTDSFFILDFLFLQDIVSQESSNSSLSYGQLIPPSPNAYSLGIYGDIPVGHYTGVPNISIPLYEIKSGKITVPISLNYHASGILVNQEASWVGLGWSLHAGGIISRTIRGCDDFGSDEISKKVIGYIQAPPIELNLLYDKIEPRAEGFDGWAVLITRHGPRERKYGTSSAWLTDAEPDLFQYNFLGYSGQMIFEKQKGPDFKALILNQDPIEVIYKSQEKQFEVTTPDGMKFYFKTVETSSKCSGKSKSFTSMNVILSESNIPTSWYLDKIEYQNDVVYFEYTNTKLKLSTQPTPHFSMLNTSQGIIQPYTPKWGEGTQSLSFHSSLSDEILLKEIRFKNGKVEFLTQAREDIAFHNYSGSSAKPRSLRNISIWNNEGSLIESYTLDTDYFGHVAGDKNYEHLRLRLNGITDKAGKSHRFIYEYSPSLPPKTDESTDHWGYYNGVDKITGTEGNLYLRYLPSMWRQRDGLSDYLKAADFSAHPYFAKANILKRIVYPTKGYTDFDFAVHKFTPFNVGGSLLNEIPTIATVSSGEADDNNPLNIKSIEFDIEKTQYVDWTIYVKLENFNCGGIGGNPEYVSFDRYIGNNFNADDIYCRLEYKAPNSTSWQAASIKYFRFNSMKCSAINSTGEYKWNNRAFQLQKGRYRLTVIGYNTTRCSSVLKYTKLVEQTEEKSAWGGGFGLRR